ncbi:uncharacterized protein LOC114575971 [Exaiptasia diaphana]|uniref:VWFA domain-containing protein n=1 Tax=Exaiptasia diaphana TaxID=2652724 RepID=A0A913YR47_EXADI|nr:uncharacterized protein LOC114575971 [Exaiptasia diaphana]
MDNTLKTGDFHKIKELITPYNLMKCRTNSLEKSLEVNYQLKGLAHGDDGANAGDFNGLAHNVQNFAYELLEPLKSSIMKRAIFEGDNFERIVDKIVEYRQKKIASHPVVYNLLMRRWTRAFYQLRYSSSTLDRFKWYLLNIWTLFDLVLFPLVFALAYVVHKIKGIARNRQDHHVVLILNAKKETFLQKMRDLCKHMIDQSENDRFKFASIIRHKDDVRTNDFMAKDGAKAALDVNEEVCEEANGDTELETCLEMLKNSEQSKSTNSNKTLVLMTDNKTGDWDRNLLRIKQQVKNNRSRVVCVGLGVHIDVKELESIATDRSCFVYLDGDIQREDGRQILEGM